MIMALKTGEAGAIAHARAPGSIISAGDLLASLTLSDPSKVAKIEPFEGTFSEVLNAVDEDETARDKCEAALDGYAAGPVDGLVKELSDDNVNVLVDDASALLLRYLAVEARYAGRPMDAVVRELVEANKDDLGAAITVAVAHGRLADRTKLVNGVLQELLRIYSNRRASGVEPAPMVLVSALAQLAALPGDAYGEVALLALRVSLVAAEEAPTPRTLDARLFNKAELTRGYALIELETGSAAATAFLGNKSDASPSKLTKPGRGGEPPVVFLFFTAATEAFQGGAKTIQASLENVLEALALARRDAKVPMTSSSAVTVRFPGGFGHVDPDFGTAALGDATVAVASRLAALRVDALTIRVGAAADLAMASPASTKWPKLAPVSKEAADAFRYDPLTPRRATARRAGSTFCYAFVGLFACHVGAAGGTFEAEELVWRDDAETTLARAPGRAPGGNGIGMVAWHCTMTTPEYPSGREIVLVANDVTFQSGSFGVEEDEFYATASKYARSRGLPRVYVACNSGASIGIVEELKPKFKVAWVDEKNPQQGYEYLYLTAADYEALPAGAVQGAYREVGGEKRFALDAVVGTKHGGAPGRASPFEMYCF